MVTFARRQIIYQSAARVLCLDRFT